MSDDSKRCPRCGAALTTDAPQGLCPKCLAAGLAAPTDPGTGPHGTKILQPAPALDAVRAAFPQLEVLQLIGRGGMGVVYQARQKSLNRLVALKLLAPERVTDAKFAERFTREAQALARLSHPNIVTIHDFGVATPPQTPDAIAHPPFYFLLMEFVDGVNLRQAMKAGRFTPEQALAIVPPVCDALQYAHERGIVHRDIKPENLLLDKDGRVKIADFGIAKMLGAPASEPAERSAEHRSAGSGVTPAEQCSALPSSATLHSAAGTPQYMAPEQREHHRTDHRADIYSLGVVLYELLTGELPGKRLEAPSRKVQIDVRLDEIVLRALETKPELRYQTAGEFRTRVETIASTPGSSRRAETDANSSSTGSGGSVETVVKCRTCSGTESFSAVFGVQFSASHADRRILHWCPKCRWFRLGEILTVPASGQVGSDASARAHGGAIPASSAKVQLASLVTLFYSVVAAIVVLGWARIGAMEALLVGAVAGAVLWKMNLLPRFTHAAFRRGLSCVAFVLSLPALAMGGFFLTQLLAESGGWRPGPAEALFVPLVWLGMLALPWAGMVLWHAAGDQTQPPESAIRTPKSEMDQSLLTSAATISRLWHAPAFVLVLLYGALLVLLFSTVPDMPQRVAIHFNAEGEADNWAGRTTHALFIAGLPLLITALFAGLAALTTKFPKLLNIPRRDYWLAPERLRFTAALMLRWLLWLACLITIFFGALHWIVLLANQTQPAKLSMSHLLPLVIGFLIACLIWTASLVMRFAEVERYEQALKQRFNAPRPINVRKHLMSAALTLAFIFIARTWLASAYSIKTDALAPELPAGSLVLAWKPTRAFAPGDLIVYRHDQGHASVGRITGSEPDAVLVNRNGQPGFRVERAKINGKVISVLWRGSRPHSATTFESTWSPTLAPDAKPDLQQISVEAQDLMNRGHYEESLQRHLWLHQHGLETSPNHSAVRLSFWLSHWAELTRRYPKAKQALIEIRDHKTRELAAGRGYIDLFMDVKSINHYLQDEPATLALFKLIEQSDPRLAKQCAILMKPAGQPTNSLVALASVESARSNLATFNLLAQAGRATPLAVLEVEQHLQWAEAMHAGDRVAAARAKRDGARRRIEHMETLFKAGRVTRAELAAVERELAEAEAALAAEAAAASVQKATSSRTVVKRLEFDKAGSADSMIFLTTHSPLLPGESLTAHYLLPQKAVVNGMVMTTISRNKTTNIENSVLHWHPQTSIGKDQIQATVGSLQKRIAAGPVLLRSGMPELMFTITNPDGIAMQGFVTFHVADAVHPPNTLPQSRVTATSIFTTGSTLCIESGEAPSASTRVEATLSGTGDGGAGTIFVSTPGKQTSQSFRWSFPDGFDQSALLTAKRQAEAQATAGGFAVETGKPVTVFSVTNRSGNVFTGSLELKAAIPSRAIHVIPQNK